MNYLVIWDFDWSLLDSCCSDRIIYESNQNSKKYMHLRRLHANKSIPWIDAINKCLDILTNESYTLDTINSILKSVPLNNNKSIELINKSKCEQIIVSDANEYNIKTILHHHNLLDYFTHIISNPTTLDANTSLFKVHPFFTDINSHNCNECPKNLCKTQAIKDYISSKYIEKPRIIYIGDGANDFCPVSNYLNKDDICLCRNNYHLHKLIKESQVNPKIMSWDNTDDLYLALNQIL